VSADFRHREHLVAHAFQPLPHPIFRFASVVFPAVVKECDAVIGRLADHPDGGFFIFCFAEAMSAEPERGDLHILPAKLAHGYGGGCLLHTLEMQQSADQ
jgi:hypothetical protein